MNIILRKDELSIARDFIIYNDILEVEYLHPIEIARCLRAFRPSAAPRGNTGRFHAVKARRIWLDVEHGRIVVCVNECDANDAAGKIILITSDAVIAIGFGRAGERVANTPMISGAPL